MKKIISENILENARNGAIKFVKANGQNSLRPHCMMQVVM